MNDLNDYHQQQAHNQQAAAALGAGYFTAPAKEPTSFVIHGDPAPLFGALALARAAFGPITKNRSVKVQTRDRGSYEFEYATLDNVQSATAPALAANGLAILQPLCDLPSGGKELRTLLTHSSGAYIECRTKLPSYEKVQELGSAMTYLRRYQWSSILGVSSEEDDDGNAADGNQAQTRDRSRPAAPPQPAPARATTPRKPPTPPQDAPKPPEAPKAQPATETPPAAKSEPPPAPTELLATADKLADMKSLFVALQFKGTPAKECVGLLTGKDAGTITNPDVEAVSSVLQKALDSKWNADQLMSLVREQAALGTPEVGAVIGAIEAETAALGGG